MIVVSLLVAGLVLLAIGSILGMSKVVYAALALSVAGIVGLIVRYAKKRTGQPRDAATPSGQQQAASTQQETATAEPETANTEQQTEKAEQETATAEAKTATAEDETASAEQQAEAAADEGEPASASTPDQSAEGESTAAEPASASTEIAEPQAGSEPEPSAESSTPVNNTEQKEEKLVYVLAGRRRFHTASCRTIAGKDTEEWTLDKANGEGFTQCNICRPSAANANGASSKATSQPA